MKNTSDLDAIGENLLDGYKALRNLVEQADKSANRLIETCDLVARLRTSSKEIDPTKIQEFNTAVEEYLKVLKPLTEVFSQTVEIPKEIHAEASTLIG